MWVTPVGPADDTSTDFVALGGFSVYKSDLDRGVKIFVRYKPSTKQQTCQPVRKSWKTDISLYTMIRQDDGSFISPYFLEELKKKQELELKKKQELELKKKQELELKKKQELELTKKQELELKKKQELELTKKQEIELKKKQKMELKKKQEKQEKERTKRKKDEEQEEIQDEALRREFFHNQEIHARALNIEAQSNDNFFHLAKRYRNKSSHEKRLQDKESYRKECLRVHRRRIELDDIALLRGVEEIEKMLEQDMIELHPSPEDYAFIEALERQYQQEEAQLEQERLHKELLDMELEQYHLAGKIEAQREKLRLMKLSWCN
jgi:hypothetical protein